MEKIKLPLLESCANPLPAHSSNATASNYWLDMSKNFNPGPARACMEQITTQNYMNSKI